MFYSFLIMIIYHQVVGSTPINFSLNQPARSRRNSLKLQVPQNKFFNINKLEKQENIQKENKLNKNNSEFNAIADQKICEQYFLQFCKIQKNQQIVQWNCISEEKVEIKENFTQLSKKIKFEFFFLQCFNQKYNKFPPIMNDSGKRVILKLKIKQMKNTLMKPNFGVNKNNKNSIKKLNDKKQFHLNYSSTNHHFSLVFRNLQQNNEQSNYLLNYKQKCNSRCRVCSSYNQCQICKNGYYKTNSQTCQPNFYLSVFSIVMSFSFKIHNYPMLYQIFFNQFAFYEYHNITSPQIYNIFEIIGNINRQKFISIFFQNKISNIYEAYQKWKFQLSLTNKLLMKQYTFIKKQKTSIYFLANVMDIIVWYLIIVIPFIGLAKILNLISKKLKNKINVFLVKYSSFQFFLMAIFQSQAQYIIFMFCKQIINTSYIYSIDKFNYFFCIIFTFPFIFLSLSGFSICSYFSSKQKLQIFYPFNSHLTLKAMLFNFITGSGKWILIGIVQSINQHCDIKMFLLLIINIILIASLNYLSPKQNNRFINQNLFIFLMNIFCLFGLFSHLNIGKNPQIHHKIQYIAITAMIILCIIQLVYFFIGYILILLNLFFCRPFEKEQIPKKQKIQTKIKNRMRTVSGFRYYN